ncbi:hypothetical protein [Flavobacterium sp. UBA7680]|uniref:hypothetical protein n=1 Tax=Flavobacterium sp. UBA7680 TaxID=1946559 RepID=UPI0025BAC859|nr:hypothetical protein [Flavobacterium sp. UBA7680]
MELGLRDKFGSFANFDKDWFDEFDNDSFDNFDNDWFCRGAQQCVSAKYVDKDWGSFVVDVPDVDALLCVSTICDVLICDVVICVFKFDSFSNFGNDSFDNCDTDWFCRDAQQCVSAKIVDKDWGSFVVDVPDVDALLCVSTICDVLICAFKFDSFDNSGNGSFDNFDNDWLCRDAQQCVSAKVVDKDCVSFVVDMLDVDALLCVSTICDVLICDVLICDVSTRVSIFP